jgi:hypothetical protein
LPVTASGEQALDFIGPSVDLGFRIAKFCDSRRFVLSADLALMLLDAVEATEVSRKRFRIHLESMESLKGVADNRPYPILWIDMNDGEHLLEERLLGIRRDFRSDDLKDYLREFIDNSPHLRRPFIDQDPDSRYSRIDPTLRQLRDQLAAEDSSRHYLDSGEADIPPEGSPASLKEPVVPGSQVGPPATPQ